VSVDRQHVEGSGRPGLLITFEGPEGSGKSTQTQRLVQRFRAEARTVVHTREPGGTPTGEEIRRILQHDTGGEPICDETETLLFAASRAQLVRQVIEPALARGDIVVCDRFADSTLAYQGYGRGIDVGSVAAINGFALGGLVPDLTLVLDIDVGEGLARLGERQRRSGLQPDRIEREALSFHNSVRRGYLRMARQWPDRVKLLDASGDVDSVAAAVLQHVAVLLDGAAGPEG